VLASVLVIALSSVLVLVLVGWGGGGGGGGSVKEGPPAVGRIDGWRPESSRWAGEYRREGSWA